MGTRPDRVQGDLQSGRMDPRIRRKGDTLKFEGGVFHLPVPTPASSGNRLFRNRPGALEEDIYISPNSPDFTGFTQDAELQRSRNTRDTLVAQSATVQKKGWNITR